MRLSFSAIDPLYAIDYSKIINSNASCNSIKAFATSLNQMTNNTYLNIFDDEDSLFNLSPSTDIYSSLYKYNNVYGNNLNNILNNESDEEKNFYMNKYKTENENALRNLYNAKEINNISDEIFSKMINEDDENIFLELTHSLDENSDEYKNLLALKKSLAEYKNINEKFLKEQNKVDKLNEENERIEAMFDLIDAINKMYTNYNKKQREKNS